MCDRDRGSKLMLGDLLAASHVMPFERLAADVSRHAAAAGVSDVLIYLCDLQEQVLRLLTASDLDTGQGPGDEEPELKIEGTLAGRAFQQGQVLPVPRTAPAGPSGYQWWVPLLDGTERLGVLRITAAADDDHTRQDAESLSALVALLVVSKRGHSDSHARLVRTRPMDVAAEMLWQLMPPRTFAASRVVIGAMMEPAYEVGGDAFDYSIAEDIVHLAIYDAMGHDTAAGLAANLAVAACRNSRHQGGGLIETSKTIEKVLTQNFQEPYVTAVVADLDTSTGMFSWINCGHPPPVLIRSGRWTRHLNCPPTHPLGSDLGLPAEICQEQLEPGDRVVLYTDGITEARNSAGREFGLDRFLDFLIRHHADELPVPETLRRLIDSILTYHHGNLNDDATVLLMQWHGPTPYTNHQVRALVGLPH